MAYQITHPLCIGSEAVGSFLRGLVWPRGLEIVTPDPLPSFPTGLDPPLALDCGGLRVQPATGLLDHEAVLPLVLVVDCKVRTADGNFYQTTTSVHPYYITPVLVLPDEVPDLSQWRRLNSIEAVCCLAQNPWLGHLRYWSKNCSGGICVAYFSGSRILVTCSEYGERNRNAAYTRWTQGSPPTVMKRI